MKTRRAGEILAQTELPFCIHKSNRMTILPEILHKRARKLLLSSAIKQSGLNKQLGGVLSKRWHSLATPMAVKHHLKGRCRLEKVALKAVSGHNEG